MWALIANFERLRDALAAKDEAIQANVKRTIGLRSVMSIAEVRTKWQTRGAYYLRKRPGLQKAAFSVSQELDQDVAKLIEATAPALAEAYDQELSNIATYAWREWPKQSGYSRSQIRVGVAQLGPTSFNGSVESAAPYTTFIKGNPARVLLQEHGKSAAERIAQITGAGVVALFNRGR